MLGITYTSTGALQKASDLLCESAEAASRYTGPNDSEKLGGPAPPSRIYARYGYVWAEAYAAYGMAELGRTEDARVHALKALKMAEQLKISYALAGALLLCAMVYARRGDSKVATRMAERALHELQNQELPIAWNLASAALGCAYNLAGRVADAITVLERGRAQVIDDALWGPMNQAYLAQAYGLADRNKEARNAAQNAIELSQRYGARAIEAWSRQIMGEIYALPCSSSTKDAHQQFGQALELAEQLGMRPLIAHCHAGFGQLHRKTNERAHAKEELTLACEMYRDMDMTHYLRKAEDDLSAI
jgi:tetratricopeptide (TPR) repeat protein